MKEISFSITISATPERVWKILWQDNTFRDWAGLIDPGTYMVGEMKEGNIIQFISSENGYGVTSKVDKLVANEFLLLSHKSDTKNNGTQEREEQWSGGKESYLLTQDEGKVILTVKFDVPEELEEMFTQLYPAALERIRTLSENISA